MNLTKESYFTLKLFAWIFYIGSGILGLWDVVSAGLGPSDLWTAAYTVISLAYLFGGLYFVFNIKKLLPRYRKQVIRAVTAIFVAAIAYGVATTAAVLLDPGALDPSLANDPEATRWVLGGSAFGFLFNLLIYLITIRAINVVSGVHDAIKRPARWATILGWLIIICMVGATIVYLYLPE